jgi:hypothetical protein
MGIADAFFGTKLILNGNRILGNKQCIHIKFFGTKLILNWGNTKRMTIESMIESAQVAQVAVYF